MRHSARGAVRKALRLLACLPLGLLALDAPPHSPHAATAIPEIILQVNDTTVSPLDAFYTLSVFLTNTLQEVAGIELTLSADRSNLLRLADSVRIDTTIICIDSTDCDPADTTIDTLSVSTIDLTGSALAGWEFLQGRALGPYTFRFAAVADFPGGTSPAPLPVSTGTPHLLFRIVLKREASLAVLDTLTDRRVRWLINAPSTSFSDPSGNTIGLQESTICLNPPVCDSLDTVSYFDPSVNIYVDGAVTFGPVCIMGDVNASGTVSAADIVYLINFVFKGGPAPLCATRTGDVDCSGTITSADVIYLVNYVYKGGPPPCPG